MKLQTSGALADGRSELKGCANPTEVADIPIALYVGLPLIQDPAS